MPCVNSTVRLENVPGLFASPAKRRAQRLCISLSEMSLHFSKKLASQSFSISSGLAASSKFGKASEAMSSMFFCFFSFFLDHTDESSLLNRGDFNSG